jgi:hypothetical protein
VSRSPRSRSCVIGWRADRHCGHPLANRGRSSTCQAEHRPGRWTGHPLEILAPLDCDLPARLHLPRHRRRRATPARCQLRPGRRTDPGHRPGAAAAPARHRHPTTSARPGPPAALVGLAAPPPAPRPPSPPTLERLRRDNTMITTNYSCRHVTQFVGPGRSIFAPSLPFLIKEAIY